MAGTEYTMPRAELDKPAKLLIVVAPFYRDIADNMIAGATAEIEATGATYDLIEVPGIAGTTVWTFSDLAAGDRVFIHINRWEYSNANQIQLQRGDGSPILTFPTLVSGGSTIFWNGTRWIAHIVTASVTVP